MTTAVRTFNSWRRGRGEVGTGTTWRHHPEPTLNLYWYLAFLKRFSLGIIGELARSHARHYYFINVRTGIHSIMTYWEIVEKSSARTCTYYVGLWRSIDWRRQTLLNEL